MNDINLMNVPAENRCFCLTNYRAFAKVTHKDGKRNFAELPKLEPIFAKTMEEAKRELAAMLNVDLRLMSEWEVTDKEYSFCPSICICIKEGAIEVGYSFFVYTTVNTLHLV
jgi:hypothetical protein